MSMPGRILLKRLVSFAGASVLSMGIGVSTALAAVTPPDMFGIVPNYANSPLPVQVAAVAPTPTPVGNPLIARAYATDNDSNVFVVNPNAITTAGNLTAFQAFAMTTAGLSASSSLGLTFHAYVLRPDGLGGYLVVLDSGALTVPSSLTADQVVDYPLGSPIAVQAGDLIAHYGQGIPVDIGTGTDGVYFPANNPPVAGTTITLGTGDFPTLDQARTYSFGAMVDVGGSPASVQGGMQKFVDSLPQLDTPNNLGQELPVAVPDQVSYPYSGPLTTGAPTNDDYYEIGYVDFREQMHSDLSGTRLRGYVQLVPEAPLPSPCGTGVPLVDSAGGAILRSSGSQAYGCTLPNYLGPIIVAHRDVPVRVKYVNLLPKASDPLTDKLFIPTDTTYMGVGAFDVSSDLNDSNSPIISGAWTENRASTHLHGGATPWISDGTPHQWTTPAGEVPPTTPALTGEQVGVTYGDSKADVPDMWYDLTTHAPILSCTGQTTCVGATNDPGPGMTTYYYTNQQSARLMFYHDHALGVTRLNVYAGMAAGYLETDSTEQAMINGGTVDYIDPVTSLPATETFTAGTLPDLGIPLVIQDKTYVPPTTGGFENLVGTFDSQLAAQDPTWDVTNWGGEGELWFPHAYMPNQNPYDLSGANAMGRWDYGPWFWPPFTGILYGEIPNPYACGGPLADPVTCVSQPPYAPGTPDERAISPSGTPESFMDTATVNGTPYPYIEVDPTVVRFRVLSVGNDRMFNLSLFVAADKTTSTTAGDASVPTVMCDGVNGGVTDADKANCTEVKMVPFNSTYDASCPANDEGPGCFPSWWYTIIKNGFTFDDRDGGVPDPTTRGPAMIQVGTEGGFLPGPVVIKNQPVNYVYNRRDITVGNVNEKALLLGPAERADVVVDFSQFAGQTLILYNDAPAPVPAADPRLDYYTGDPDQTDTGGAPSTLPGYGPNTRTVMQIRVRNTAPTNPSCIDPATGATVTQTQDCVSPVYTTLQTALPAAFRASQEPIIVPQAAYSDVYPGLVPTVDRPSVPPDISGTVVRIQDTDMTLTPIGQAQLTLPLQPKAIIEDFTVDYGRMNALLGVEVPHTNNTNQTSLIEAYIDPPTELVRLTAANSTPAIGEASDGTQLWKITHNGVDTHALHFHMFHVQVVNRVGWDGAIRLPDANELGWKDTVRMNPLEDIIVAMRPKTLDLPFDVPNSWRPLDPTQQLGAQWQALQPTGNGAVTVTNEITNFGWEHVWHCHILGHEENDMMRALAIVAPPQSPLNLTATLNGTAVDLAWTDNSVNETSFTVQRSVDEAFTTPVDVATLPAVQGTGSTVTYTDNLIGVLPVYYRVIASNTVGSPTPGYDQLTADSDVSNTAVVLAPVPVAGVSPTSLLFGNVDVGTTSAPQSVTLSNTGNGPLTINSVTTTSPVFGVTNNCGGTLDPGLTCTIDVTFAPTVAGDVTAALNIVTNDPVNGTLTVSLSGTGVEVVTIPAAPTNLTGTAVRSTATTDLVTLNWVDNSNNETGFNIQRAQVFNTNPNICNVTTAYVNVATVGANVTTYSEQVTRQGNMCYRVQSFNSAGASTWAIVYVATP